MLAYGRSAVSYAKNPWFTATASSAMLVKYMDEFWVSLKRVKFGPISCRYSLTAVNYRLAPQYPFPCAIQDLLAACE